MISLYKILNKPKHLFWLVFFITSLLLLLGGYASLRFGAINFSHQDLLITFRQPFTNSDLQDVMIDIRLPRIIGSLLVGAATAQAGAIIQGVTRNPIADPGLLGINAGAGLALVIAYAVFGQLHYTWIVLICLLGSTLAALMVFALSYDPKRGYNQLRLILAGTMISALFTALGQIFTITFNLATTIIGWQSGGLVAVNWKMLSILAPIILVSLILAQLFSHQLTILSLNETVAKSLGQKTVIMTLFWLGLVILLSASAVALAGTIAFVGLIIPHIVKFFCPHNYRQILPMTAFLGATFMLWIDLLCRTINPPYETPLSAMVSLVGLPCFLWLMKRRSL
ncbi:FecCD family ABC transporter permease [Streptococcus sp. S784/96/1]|uniref:FecCD family ABC transporter permease n=1 Tax=Streptococcus sp. S784/96/1 TaxID=2653499 RepID=UPI001389599B|nr:iron ABC transporter permease [Streptococcus sp. S784/96/1]